MPRGGAPGARERPRGQEEPRAARWLLLIHQVPPKPDYLRVKVRRRLERVGAIPLKASVYVLPHREDSREDFQWLAREITGDGGEASVCEATFVEDVRDEELVAAFRTARDADYGEIARAADVLGRQAAPGDRERESGGERAAVAALARLSRRLADVTAIDFFDAPARADAEAQLRAAAERLRGPREGNAARGGRRDGATVRGRTWVTREGVFVDRMGSAWLIRRFIDPDARFRFVPPHGHRPVEGELRFDMFEAEYTHEGDRCTFETLIARFDLRDAALQAVAEIVHDIDLKDEKFARAESAGVERLLAGIAAAHPSDAARLDRAALIFDDLYAAFGATLRAP